jgi:hypothetical protein
LALEVGRMNDGVQSGDDDISPSVEFGSLMGIAPFGVVFSGASDFLGRI